MLKNVNIKLGEGDGATGKKKREKVLGAVRVLGLHRFGPWSLVNLASALSINSLEEDECVDETYTDPDHAEYNIKVPPPPPVQKPKPPIQRNFILHTRDSLLPHIPYPSRMLKQKQQEKDDIQIQKFWNMFKQLHLNITLAEALVLMPKYQKMLKALLYNKEKLQELANTPSNENCSAVILKKLPEKLGDPGKFLIPCRFKLAHRAICTPDGIARDVFVPVARALIDVYGEEMILRDGDERLTLNMKHDTASYSNHPYRESVKLINIFNLSSEDCLKDLVSHKQSGNPTFSLHKEIASSKVIPEFHDSKGCTSLSEELPDIDSFNDIHPHFDDDPLSGSTTYSANSLLEEFADELALISYPLDYDDYRACDIEDDVLFSPDNEDKDFDPPFYELLVFKEVPISMRLLPFSSENEEKVFKPGIYTSKKLSSIPGFMKILANGFHYLKSSLSPLFHLGITYPDLID
nr:hypothetical protein [Tanacetum cinerariifolium]